MKTTEIAWGVRGEDCVILGADGLTVGTGCCGCVSEDLTDRDAIRQIRDALSEFLEAAE